MNVIRIADVTVERADRPIFQGIVHQQPLVTDAMAKGLRLAVITFDPGARTVDHAHSHEQVLCVIAGRGILATETERHEVEPGTIIFVPAGERHWHGATADSSFSHISITTPGETTLY